MLILSAVITHLTETQSSVITDDIKRRVILLHELHLPLVDGSSLHLTVARLATVLRGIAFGLKLLPTAFTLFFKSHRTIDINDFVDLRSKLSVCFLITFFDHSWDIRGHKRT